MMFSNITHNATKKIMQLEVSDIDLSVVNSLRRIILAEIPNVAVAFDPLSDNNPDIQITTNTGPLHNEFLGHRISLLPICLSEKEIDEFEPNKYRFVLQVKNTSNEIINVTTKDIQIFDDTGKKYSPAFHSRVFPSDPITKEHPLIVKLRPNMYEPSQGEELDITFYASKNIAQSHSRWSPVSCCSLWNKIDEKKAAQVLKEKLDNATDDITAAAIRRKFETLDKQRCYIVNQYDEPSHWHFMVESECALAPKSIFGKAIDILYDKVRTFGDRVNDKDPSVEITCIHDSKEMYQVIISQEDYTLLNVLQSLMYNMYIREKEKNLQYVGYHQTHPLDNKMLMKLKFHSATDEDQVAKFLMDASRDICNYIKDVKQEWINALVSE